MKGFDVSHFQPKFNWAAARAAGYQFGAYKLTDGKSGQDFMGRANRAAAAAAGIPAFAYHFFRFDDDPALQLKNFLSVLGQVNKGEIYPAVDVEWDNLSKDLNYHDEDHGGKGYRQTMDERAAAAVYSFVKNLAIVIGARPILYTNPYFFTGFGQANRFAECIPWICNYQAQKIEDVPMPAPWSGQKLLLWQNSEKLAFAGETNIDGNVFNGGLDDLQNLIKQGR